MKVKVFSGYNVWILEEEIQEFLHQGIELGTIQFQVNSLSGEYVFVLTYKEVVY